MSDPADFNDIVLLVNFDGANNDTSYTAEIDEGTPVLSFNNGAKLSSTDQQFSVTNAYTDGTDDYLGWGGQADSQFLHDGTVDWTIEIWLRLWSMGPGSDRHILSTKANTSSVSQCGISIYHESNGRLRVQITDDDSVLCSMYTSSGVLTTSAWAYIKVTFDTTTGWSLRVGGTELDTDTLDTPGATVDTNSDLKIGRRSNGDFNHVFGRFGPIRITKGEALNDSDVPTDLFPMPVDLDGWLSIPGPLNPAGTYFTAFQDFSAYGLTQASRYVMELTGDTPYRIPISSWQATLQLDRSNYVQCVIPAVDDYADEITTRQPDEEFVIYSIVTVGGAEQKSEIARSAMEQVTFDEGPYRYTCTITGYSDAYAAPVTPKTRTLANIRSKNTGTTGKLRVRCDIDWYLRPGDTAMAGGDEMTATYINYYMTSQGDAYMDVGER